MRLQTIQKSNKLYGQLPIEEGVLTDLDNFFSSIDINKVLKYGNVVTINFRGLLAKDLPGNTTPFLKAPWGAKLGTNYTNVIHTGARYSIDGMSWIYLDGNGNFRGSAVSSGKYIHISIVYISN
jgi:hypothetical protein